MTTDSSSIATTTQILAGGNTIVSILFELPGLGTSITPGENKELARLIGPAIERWLISYAGSRNLDLTLPTSLLTFALSSKALNRVKQELDQERELEERLAWELRRSPR